MNIDPYTLRMLSQERVDALIKEADHYRRASRVEEVSIPAKIKVSDALSRFQIWNRPNRRILPRGI